jgi:hypothetical protein
VTPKDTRHWTPAQRQHWREQFKAATHKTALLGSEDDDGVTYRMVILKDGRAALRVQCGDVLVDHVPHLSQSGVL